MKKTILASVAVAAIFAFSSCQKEDLENTSVSGVRVITAEFENTATKTTLNEDGKTPQWAVGDKICLLSSTSKEVVTLAAENIVDKKITFTTSLTGTLYAVYPASATTMTSCSDGKITFTIPAIQDGTFASANICVAKSSTDGETNKDKLVFSNATSVLEFSQTAATTQVLSVRVEAANAIAGPMTVVYKADGTFDTPTTSSLSEKFINVKSTTAVDKYYIAVAPVTTGKIEFEYQQAVKVATVTTEAGKTLAANKIYECSMDGKNFVCKTGTINGHDYVQVGSVKWATMNLGATKEASSYAECAGDYYAWGETEPYYGNLSWSGTTCTLSNWKTGKSSGYGWPSYCGKESFEEWSPAPYNTTKILKAEHDAATVNWGTGWRMHTLQEFSALYDACDGKPTTKPGGSTSTTDRGIYWCDDYNGVAGLLFIVDGARLFFPAVGLCGYNNHYNASPSGFYWSSTLDNTDSSYAYYLFFMSGTVTPSDRYTRFCGCPVRPVAD